MTLNLFSPFARAVQRALEVRERARKALARSRRLDERHLRRMQAARQAERDATLQTLGGAAFCSTPAGGAEREATLQTPGGDQSRL